MNKLLYKTKWLDDNICTAEGAFAYNTVLHHGSYNSVGCTPGLLRGIFADSDTASKA
jgi:hypothetical protein